MKKLTLATLLIISCSSAWAADFDKGLAENKAICLGFQKHLYEEAV